MKRARWQPEEDDVMRAGYADQQTRALARALGRTVPSLQARAKKLGLRKSDAFHSSPASGRLRDGNQRGAGSRFCKGSVPCNKGWRRPGYAPGRMAETQFKKGRPAKAARNYVPIGTEKITKDGQLVRKVTDDPTLVPARRWTAVTRLVWEEANGPIPKGHVVAFKTGMATTDPACITPEKLELLTHAQNLARNSRWNRFPPELNALIAIKGSLTRKINQQENLK